MKEDQEQDNLLLCPNKAALVFVHREKKVKKKKQVIAREQGV